MFIYSVIDDTSNICFTVRYMNNRKNAMSQSQYKCNLGTRFRDLKVFMCPVCGAAINQFEQVIE